MNITKEKTRHNMAGKVLYCAAWLLAAALAFPGSTLAGTVIISGSPPGSIYGNSNDDSGGTNDGTGSNNSVTIRPVGSVGGNVYGAQLTTGDVSVNTVDIDPAGYVAGDVFGGYTNTGNATDNTVTVNGGRVDGAISGGSAMGGDARNNTVNIDGAAVLNTVTAGESASGVVVNNTINVRGTPTIKVLDGCGGPSGWGNTLNLYTASLTVQQVVQGFDNINFYLPASVANGDTILTTQWADIAGTTINVGVQGSGSPLKAGDTITLIEATTVLIGAPVNNQATGVGMQGISTQFTFDLATANNALLAEVISASANEQLKSLAESRVSGIGMLTQGADMLATQGIPQLRLNALGTSGPAMFGVMGGQSLRYNSGSHVDVDGFNLATGLGWNFPLSEGRNGNLLVGAFFEAGWGSYDSHNSFGNAATVKGDGDTNYYGVGILARYDTAPVGPGNIYLESSIRAGKVETDYDSSGFQTASGNEVNFDSSAAYYGAHAGIGYIWNMSENSSLDMYTKYLWTRQDSDSVTIEGDNIRFKAMDSHRWRTGARYAYNLDTASGLRFTPYIGAAYEHEFDSKAKATSNGNSIDAPDVKGGTGIGELGVSFKPSATSGLSLDLAAQGYTGKREGVGGHFQIKFEF